MWKTSHPSTITPHAQSLNAPEELRLMNWPLVALPASQLALASSYKGPTKLEIIAFDLRQEADIKSGIVHGSHIEGYGPGECLKRVLQVVETFPIDTFPFDAKYLEPRTSVPAPAIISPTSIAANIDFLRNNMLNRQSCNLPDAAQLHYRRLFASTTTMQSDINSLPTSPSRSQALIHAILQITGLQTVCDDNYFAVAVEYLRHRESLVEHKLCRLHNLTICPQSLGKTPLFNLTTSALASLKKDIHTRDMFVLNQENNISEYCWSNEFESHGCYHLQASDEMMSVANPSQDPSKGPRTCFLLRGFFDGFLADTTIKNKTRTNTYFSHVRVNRSGFLQVDASESVVFDAIKAGDSGLYKRCEIGYYEDLKQKPIAEQISIEYSIADLRRLQLEGVVRCYGHACDPNDFSLCDAAREIIHSTEYFLKTMPDLYQPTQHLVNDGLSHLFAHAVSNAMTRTADLWIFTASENDARLVIPSTADRIVQCYCQAAAEERPLNLPCFRDKVSPVEHGNLGYVCFSWHGKFGKNANDCGFVLPKSQEETYQHASLPEKRIRAECTTMDCANAYLITAEDAALAANHFVRSVATLQLQLRNRKYQMSTNLRDPERNSLNSGIPICFFAKHMVLQREALKYDGYINSMVLDVGFGKGKGQDARFQTHRAYGGSYGALLIGDIEEWETRKKRKTWRRKIISINSDPALFKAFPNLSECAADVIISAGSYLQSEDSGFMLTTTELYKHDATVVEDGTLSVDIQETVNIDALIQVSQGTNSTMRAQIDAIIQKSKRGMTTTYKKKIYGRAVAEYESLQSLPRQMREAALSGLGHHVYEYKQTQSHGDILYRRALHIDSETIEKKCILLAHLMENPDVWVIAVAAYFDVTEEMASDILCGITRNDACLKPLGACSHLPHIAVLKAEMHVCIRVLMTNDPSWGKIHDYSRERQECTTLNYLYEAEHTVLRSMSDTITEANGKILSLNYDSLYFYLPQEACIFDLPSTVHCVRVETHLVSRGDRDKNALGMNTIHIARRDNCMQFALRRIGFECGKNIQHATPAALGQEHGIYFHRIATVGANAVLFATGRFLTNGVGHAFAVQKIGTEQSYRFMDVATEDLIITARELRQMIQDNDITACEVSREAQDAIDEKDELSQTPMGSNKKGTTTKKGVNKKTTWRKNVSRSRSSYRPTAKPKVNRRKKGESAFELTRITANETIIASQTKCFKFSRDIDQYLKTRAWFRPSKKRMLRGQHHQCAYCGSILHNAISHQHGLYSMCKYDIFPTAQLRLDAKTFLEAIEKVVDPLKHYESLKTPGAYTTSGGNAGKLLPRKQLSTLSALQINQMEISEFFQMFYGRTAFEWMCPDCNNIIDFTCEYRNGISEIHRVRCNRRCRSRKLPLELNPLRSQKVCPRTAALIILLRALNISKNNTPAIIGHERHMLLSQHKLIHAVLARDQFRHQSQIMFDGTEHSCHTEADEYLVAKGSLPSGRTVSLLAVGILQRGVVDSLAVYMFHIESAAQSMPMTPHCVWQEYVYADHVAEKMKGHVVLHHDGWNAYNSGYQNPSTNNFNPAYEDTVVFHTDAIYWLLDIPTGWQCGTQHIDNTWRQIRRHMTRHAKRTTVGCDTFTFYVDDFRAGIWLLQHRGSVEDKVRDIISVLNADGLAPFPPPRIIIQSDNQSMKKHKSTPAQSYGGKPLPQPEFETIAQLTREDIQQWQYEDLKLLMKRRGIPKPKHCDSKQKMIDVLIDGSMAQSENVQALAKMDRNINTDDLLHLPVAEIQQLIRKLDIPQSRSCSTKEQIAAKIIESQKREAEDDPPFWVQRERKGVQRSKKNKDEPRSSWES